MTIRVEMKNAGINTGRMRVREMTMEEDPKTKVITLRPAPGAGSLMAIPGQSAAMRAGETKNQVLLIDELPPEDRPHLPAEDN